jgi:hypothetical protein
MLYVGLFLSRQRLDVHVLDEQGQTVEVTAVRPNGDALRALAVHIASRGQEVSGAIESMTSGWVTRSRPRHSLRLRPRRRDLAPAVGFEPTT